MAVVESINPHSTLIRLFTEIYISDLWNFIFTDNLIIGYMEGNGGSPLICFVGFSDHSLVSQVSPKTYKKRNKDNTISLIENIDVQIEIFSLLSC